MCLFIFGAAAGKTLHDFGDVSVEIPGSWKVIGREEAEEIARRAGTSGDGTERLLVVRDVDPNPKAMVRLKRIPGRRDYREFAEEVSRSTVREAREAADDYFSQMEKMPNAQAKILWHGPFEFREIGRGVYPAVQLSWRRRGQLDPGASWLVRMFWIGGPRHGYLLTISCDQRFPDA